MYCGANLFTILNWKGIHFHEQGSIARIYFSQFPVDKPMKDLQEMASSYFTLNVDGSIHYG
jgi:hypothetical protein